MKIMHIEGRYKGDMNFQKIDAEKLPGKISLVTTVQFMDYISQIKDFLEKKGKEVMVPNTNATYRGQVLGCSIRKLEGEAILYVGDGDFHWIALALENEVPVYTFNPFSENFSKVRDEQIKKLKQIQKAGISRFHSSKKIGVLVSVKPGQFNIKAVEKLRKKYPAKTFFTLVFDTLEPAGLSDFNFIECFVNTACPRISFDDYSKFEKKIVEYNYVT